MSNEDRAMITTITNSDPGRHVSTWGPFSYYEGFNSIDIVCDGGEDSGSSRISMTGHGFIEIATSSGRKLCIDDAGEVTVWQMSSDGKICIGVDDSIAIQDDGEAAGASDGNRADIVKQARDLMAKGMSMRGAATELDVPRATLARWIKAEPVLETNAERIDHVIALAKSGKEFSTNDLAELFGTTVRSVQHLLVEAVQKDPAAFIDAAEAEDPAEDE